MLIGEITDAYRVVHREDQAVEIRMSICKGAENHAFFILVSTRRPEVNKVVSRRVVTRRDTVDIPTGVRHLEITLVANPTAIPCIL